VPNLTKIHCGYTLQSSHNDTAEHDRIAVVCLVDDRKIGYLGTVETRGAKTQNALWGSSFSQMQHDRYFNIRMDILEDLPQKMAVLRREYANGCRHANANVKVAHTEIHPVH
jgi:hypothetical protein